MSNDSENLPLNNDGKDFQSLDGLRVLVVDDDEDACVLIAFILEGYGAEVMIAASALEALEVMKQCEPDVLISDIAMPAVDGYSFLRRVRAFNPPLGTIPAVAITAVDTEEARDLAFKAGFQAYLVKPVEPEDLATELVKLLKLPYISSHLDE